MKIFITKYKVIFISFLAVSSLFLASCQNASNENSNAVPQTSSDASVEQPKDDVAELGTRIRLEIAPEEVVWREETPGKQESRTPGPNEKKLIAVLKYKSEDAARIAAQAEKIRPPQPAQIGTEGWYPAELTAQSQLSGDESLKGTVYAANDFLQPPYANGKLTRVENTDYFVLELTTF